MKRTLEYVKTTTNNTCWRTKLQKRKLKQAMSIRRQQQSERNGKRKTQTETESNTEHIQNNNY